MCQDNLTDVTRDRNEAWAILRKALYKEIDAEYESEQNKYHFCSKRTGLAHQY